MMDKSKDTLGFMIGEDIYVEFDMENMVEEDENGNLFVNTHVYRVVESDDGSIDREKVPYDEMSDEVMEKVETAVNTFLSEAIRRGIEEDGYGDELFADSDVDEIEVGSDTSADTENNT
jgi:hypothetical protein